MTSEVTNLFYGIQFNHSLKNDQIKNIILIMEDILYICGMGRKNFYSSLYDISISIRSNNRNALSMMEITDINDVNLRDTLI